MRRLLPALVLAMAAATACHNEPDWSPGTLALFEPTANGCEWRQLDPVTGRMSVVGTMASACTVPAVAWDASLDRALVATTAAAWLWSGESLEALPPVREGVIVAAGFGESGAPHLTTGRVQEKGIYPEPRSCFGYAHRGLDLGENAWVAGDWTPQHGCWPRGKPASSPDVEDFPRLRPFAGDPVDDEALLYRLTTASLDPPPSPRRDQAEILAATAAATALRGISSAERMMRSWVLTWTREPSALALGCCGVKRGKFRSPMPLVRAAEWYLSRLDSEGFGRTPEPWFSASFESGLRLAQSGSTLVFVTPDRIAVPEQIPAGKKTAWVREPYLLVTTEDGASPRVYDGRTGTLVWKSDTATGATFWPFVAKP